MRTRIIITLLLLSAGLMVVSTLLLAGSTGQIKGVVTDKVTRQPVVGASVLVVGTTRGTVTDSLGNFVIANVEPGVYTLRISHIAYREYEVTDVTVKSDISPNLALELQKGTTELTEKIVVSAKRDPIARIEASSQQTIPLTPVTTVSNLLNQATGVVASRDRKAAYCVTPGFPPAHGGTSIVNDEPFDAMFFKHYGVNPFVDTEDDHLSTFAIDVDDASYVMTRSYLERGYLPPDEAVRTEEFVNHFKYNYQAPQETPFEVYFEGAPSMFGQNCELLKIGIKGKKILAENRKPANLIFVIDVSGSMARENRLTLVKKALRLLIDELTPEDKVGIVVYGSRGRVILEPTSIERKNDIIAAIEQLIPSGSTNAEEGLRLGYDMAQRHFEKGKINRVILCSDGVANVGRTSAEAFLKWIKKHADKGITLTTVGFGMGNYNDILMEKLGDKGNGHYAYVDNLPEARRIFVENLTGTLQVIARDVKIQVDFNPDVVRSYRLLGYENRDVDDDKFRDDKEDGGEIGSGHEVTALYEIKLRKEAPPAKIGTIYIRYKDPDSDEVAEISRPIRRSVFHGEFVEASVDFKLAAAAAEFAEILRKSYWAKGSELKDVLALVKDISNEIDSPDVIELMSLVSKAQQYEQQLAEKQ
ncbi:MAG: von Willebrand factor type A domain-containing protein [Candidatus Zixiibacteriota bacterium]